MNDKPLQMSFLFLNDISNDIDNKHDGNLMRIPESIELLHQRLPFQHRKKRLIEKEVAGQEHISMKK